MAKRSNSCSLRYEKDQLGCMWGLISMLDFRHSRSTRRLLSDRRRGDRNAVGAPNTRNKPETLTSSAEDCPRSLDGEEERTVIDACKPSVKKLLEEEMSGEVAKKEASNSEVEVKQFYSGEGGNGRKNWNRKNKTCKKSSSSSLHMDVAENLVPERSRQHKPEQQTTSNLDMDNLMEEFFRKIHQKRVNCMNHDQLEQNPKSYGSEESLNEAIKVLVSQKFLIGNQLTEDGELLASNGVMDALPISSLDEELFLKLLPDLNLLKYVQDLPDAHLKDEESKPLAESNFSDMESTGLRQRNEPVNRKQRNFFRRKLKSQERELSDGNKASQASNKIVVLKPGSTCLQTPETGSSLDSPSDSQYIISHREPNEKVGSHFFLAEIKRKLKHAMGRDQQRIPTNGISEKFPAEQQNSEDSGRVKEYFGMNSPTKDQFFIGRIGRPSIDVAKGEKTSKLKGSELSTEYETIDFSMKRVSNIYIEAKKHLSDLLTNEDQNEDLLSTQVPKTLGRILSLPEYNTSPVGSPGRNLEHSFTTAQMRFAGSDKLQMVSENDRFVSLLRMRAEKTDGQLCISENKSDNEVESDNAISNNLDTSVNNDKEDPIFCSIKDELSSKESVSIVKATEMMVHEESKSLDISSETSDSSIITDDKNVDIYEVCDEKQNPWYLKQDSSEVDQQPFSPLSSPSDSSVMKKVERLESVTDIPERSSPVSVLDPIFADDLISPASIRTYSGETSIQPLRIRFEEHDSLATNQSNRIKTCMADKESIFEHIKAVLQASSFSWDKVYIRSLSSDLLIDPLLVDEVEYLPNQLCQDQKLLFDCINEVVREVCEYYFGSPSVSFVKPNIRPIPNMKNTIQEVWEGVYWHLLPTPLPCTLDLIVRKDLAKTGTWMDLQLDTGYIGVEIGEAIFEDLVEDTITSYINGSWECEYNVLPA
ncbi:hypothetical protein ERO13_A03G095500v2 [Gossypium hirsutum]|uniref:Protein TRM32-like n=1 Tax=Gossypium hirsutum TaxID=3635 RepID=A0A1U8I7T8_GOSHI|nr:uncharacterized protein LOC107893709 [Gossypium hirsutum]KAG4207852.1 hypothetical protein ERO13_A03G095500v2 [Gossypium hirsutum]